MIQTEKVWARDDKKENIPIGEIVEKVNEKISQLEMNGNTVIGTQFMLLEPNTLGAFIIYDKPTTK